MKFIRSINEISREAKEILSEDDINDILDMFELQISDKYKIEFLKPSEFFRAINRTVYMGRYNLETRVYEINIRRSNIRLSEFNKDIRLLKARLSKHGFAATGHPSKGNYQNEYFLFIYKPMFPKRVKK